MKENQNPTRSGHNDLEAALLRTLLEEHIEQPENTSVRLEQKQALTGFFQKHGIACAPALDALPIEGDAVLQTGVQAAQAVLASLSTLTAALLRRAEVEVSQLAELASSLIQPRIVSPVRAVRLAEQGNETRTQKSAANHWRLQSIEDELTPGFVNLTIRTDLPTAQDELVVVLGWSTELLAELKSAAVRSTRRKVSDRDARILWSGSVKATVEQPVVTIAFALPDGVQVSVLGNQLNTALMQEADGIWLVNLVFDIKRQC